MSEADALHERRYLAALCAGAACRRHDYATMQRFTREWELLDDHIERLEADDRDRRANYAAACAHHYGL